MMNNVLYFRVAAYQGPIVEKSPELSLEKTIDVMNEANNQDIDILCMPETFLHGLLATKEEALEFSIDLKSTEFASLCQKFSVFKKTTLLLGLNEREGNALYNTVVVIDKGACIGKYRKAYYDGDYFLQGNSFPVFEKRGVKYSILICYDSWFREPALISALKGADVLFCPSFNRIRNESDIMQRLARKNHCIARAYDTQCWFVASDIIWYESEEDNRLCPGFACILDTHGNIITEGSSYTEMLLTHSIPMNELLNGHRKKRLLGNEALFDIFNEHYRLRMKNPFPIDAI